MINLTQFEVDVRAGAQFSQETLLALVARVRELTLALQTAKAHMVNYRQDCTTCAVVDRALTPSEPRDA